MTGVQTCTLPLSIQPAFTASAATKKATSLKLSGSLTAMHVGQSCKMSYKMKPSKKAESVSWKSSNKKILTIDKSGKLKAKKEGTSKITATTPSGKKASTSVLVVNKLGETSKQKRINQILKSSKTKKLYINNTKKASKYKIKKGNYSKKSLTINTSSSTIANYGTFKSIRIKGMGNKRFTEYAKGNKITASGKKFSLYVKKQVKLKSLT